MNASTNFCPRLAVERARQGHAAAIGKVERVELQAVAQKFGMSEQDLVKALRDGNSLATLAQQRNVSRDDLKATMRGALKTQLDQAVANKKIDQSQEDKALAKFDANADKLIDRQWGQGKSR